ncbi:MAG: pilus assembly protein PilM [bacterium]
MSRSSVKKFIFNTPKILLMPAVGIDISDHSVKYAELIQTSRGYELGRFGDITIPSGIVEGGKIVNPPKLAEVLNNLRVEQNLSFVRSALPEEQVYFFRARYPDGTNDVLRETIELSLEDHVPIPAGDAVFDFEIVGRVGTDVDVSVTVATHVTIESYSDVFRAAGLTLLSLELEASAIARSVISSDDTGAHLIVDFGEARTGVAIVCNGQVYVTSTVSVGGQMLTETVARHMGISQTEAESLKREFGLQRNSAHEELFAILLTNIAILRDEINKHLIYWHTHPDESGNPRPEITKIFLVGGDSNLPGLPEYMSTSLKIQAVVGDIWTNVNMPSRGIPQLPREASLGYGTSIGLALYNTEHEN